MTAVADRFAASPWLLGAPIARGDGTTVVAGRDRRTDQAVAIKIADPGDPGAVAAVRREGQLLAVLAHPHLVALAGTVDDGTTTAVVTAGVPGGSLAGVLAGSGPLPWPAVAAILAPVADALAAVHTAGFVHGDVSTANVLVGEAGGYLADLGCSRRVADPGPATGTPGAAAPEVTRGQPPSTPSDVWALAAVAVEALTGEPPSPGVVLPAGTALVLRRALAPAPEDRPLASGLAAALADAADPDAIAAIGLSATLLIPPAVAGAGTREFGPRPPSPPMPAPARRGSWIVAGAVAAAAVAVAATLATPPRPGVAAEPVAVVCPAGPTGASLVGDPDGDGCQTAASWHDGILTVVVQPGRPPDRFAVGAPGDVVALGDWDCDGSDTPGTYRPATGAVTLYDAWPTAGQVLPASTSIEQPGAAATVVHSGDCDQLVVVVG